MAGKSSNFANELLKLIFNGTPIANIADNAASSPITNWELSLHTALPTSGQNHNEVTYTGYALQNKITQAEKGGGIVRIAPVAVRS